MIHISSRLAHFGVASNKLARLFDVGVWSDEMTGRLYVASRYDCISMWVVPLPTVTATSILICPSKLSEIPNLGAKNFVSIM